MDDCFFQEPAPADGASDGSSNKKAPVKNSIQSINVPYKNAVVILMNHPSSIYLYKYVSVTVLSGTVSINGYEINQEHKSVQVFSSEKTGLFQIKTEDFESIWKKKTSHKTLEKNLRSIFEDCEQMLFNVLKRFGKTTVAVYIKRLPLPSNVDFVQYYLSEPFKFNLCKKTFKNDHCFFLENKGSPIDFGSEEEALAGEIAISIRSSKMGHCDIPRIVVYGPRNSGKSTLLKYLVNRMLSQYSCIRYLDTDPGQPEFTPPGVVSLTKVNQPILEPPAFHQKKNSKMIFVGDVSPSYVDLYNRSITTLMELYNTEYADEPLFVNTMGWLEGVGLQFLASTIATVKPTILVEIAADDETPMFDYRDFIPVDCQYYQLSCKQEERKSVLPAKVMRDMSLLSHLGYCQRTFLSPLPINHVRPYCVPWKKIAISVFPEKSVPPHRMVEALNGSIVALCSVDTDLILETEIPMLPLTLEAEPQNECLAYGLVLAVNERDELLYIITYLKEEQLQRVNAIIRGNVMVPDALILKQPVQGVIIPFTNAIGKSSTEEDDLNLSKISLTNGYDTESPVSTPIDSKLNIKVENYRQPISYRYSTRNKRKFSKNN